MKNRTIINVIATIFVRFGSKSINFLFFLIIARTLSASEMGIYGLIFSTSLIMTVLFSFGLRNSIAKYIGGDRGVATDVMLTLHLFWILASLISILSILFLTEIFELFEGVKKYIPQFSLLISGSLYIRIFQSPLLALGLIKDFNKSEIFPRIILISALTIYSFTDGINLDSALWCLALSQILSVAFIFAMFVKNNLMKGRVDKGAMREMLLRGGLFMVASLAMNVAGKLVFYLLSEQSSFEVSGAFFKTVRLSEIITEVALGIAVVMFSKSVVTKCQQKYVDNLAVMCRFSIAMLFAITTVLYLFSDFILLIAFNETNELVLDSFKITVLATFLSSVWVILFPSLAVRESPLEIALLFLPSILISAVSFKIFSPDMTIKIAALIYLLSNLITSVIYLQYCKMKYSVRYTNFIFIKTQDIKTLLETFRTGFGKKNVTE